MSRRSHLYEYDERGNVIREYYESDYYCDNEYDGDILKRRVCTEPRDDHKTIREYEFDDNKNIVNYKVTVYEADGSIKNTYREERSYNAEKK